MNKKNKEAVLELLLGGDDPYRNPTKMYMTFFNEIPVYAALDISESRLSKFFNQLEDYFKMENIMLGVKYEKFDKYNIRGALSVDFKNKIVINRTSYSDLHILYDTNNNKSKKAFKKCLEMSKGYFPVPKKKTKRGRIYVLAVKGTGMKASIQFMPFKLDKFSISIPDNYNDDFQHIHAEIIRKLAEKDGNGIAVLHGEAGTGKTFYLKHLCRTVKKKILYIPPALVPYIVEPGFINILGKHKNSILVIEDADNVLRGRDMTSDIQTVSSILNIADGMLHDVLKLQIVATFNTKISNIDEAFLRKGRLIAEYKFEKLTKEKAQILSNNLGYKTKIKEDMTLADIYNQGVPHLKRDTSGDKVGYKLRKKSDGK